MTDLTKIYDLLVIGIAKTRNPKGGFSKDMSLITKGFEGPLAVVILGGLTTSTVLSLFVLPTLALRFGRFRPRDMRPPARCALS